MTYRIRRGDCLELLPTLPEQSIDLILCDLPYGSTKCAWDIHIPFNQLWPSYRRVIKANGAIILFGQEPFSSYLRLSNLAWYKYDWIWEKERLTNIMQVKKRPGKTVELISVFYATQPNYQPQMVAYTGSLRTNKVKNGRLGQLVDGSKKQVNPYQDTQLRYPTQILKFQRDMLTSNLHPTQKPVALLEYLIQTYTNQGDWVLDNCMGSGSTGVACINTNRNFIGFELDRDYYRIARQRLREAKEQLKSSRI